jgi:hypothetical protein
MADQREWLNMSGVGQAVFMNQRSFVEPAPTVIGQAFGGGFYAGEIGVSSVATHYLVIGPLSTAQSTLAWKNDATTTPGTDSDIDGPQNTADMVAAGNATVFPCAHFCNNLVTGGFSDWYMPAKNELDVCYFNLKPTTTNNWPSGINPNAVPARTISYTILNPAQTSAAAFQSGGSEAFAADNYWTSTEFSAGRANGQDFNNGYQGMYGVFNKTTALKVRAIRRVAV